MQFIYYLVKKIDKLRLDRRQGDYLTACWRQDPEGCEAQLRRFWPGDVKLISQAASSGDWVAVQPALPALRATLRRSPRFSSRFRPPEWVRKIARVLRPNGLMVAIPDADDYGGSRMVAKVLRDMAPAFRGTWHANASVARRLREGAPDSAATGAGLVRIFFTHVVSHFAAVRPRKVRSTLIISDRHYPAILVDPRRYYHGGSAMLARLAGRLMPQPDLWILLRAPAQRSAARGAETMRTSADYPAFLRSTPASVVNASQDMSRVAHDIDRAIVAYLARRTERRHGAGQQSATLAAAKPPPFGDRRFRS